MFALIAAAALSLSATDGEQKKVFTESSFQHLRFLEGRWKGKGPAGSPFYEEYDFPEPTAMRSRRFPDESFGTSTDGSAVVLEAGKIISRWGDYSWEADGVTPGYISFAPVNAPSSFSWRQVDANTVQVLQKWRDENGVEQSYVVPLERINSK